MNIFFGTTTLPYSGVPLYCKILTFYFGNKAGCCCCCCICARYISSILKYINNGLQLVGKNARTIIICSKKQTVFREHSSRSTVSFEKQIMSMDKFKHIFVPNGGHRTYYPSNIIRTMGSFENWGISLDISQF